MQAKRAVTYSVELATGRASFSVCAMCFHESCPEDLAVSSVSRPPRFGCQIDVHDFSLIPEH
jgi:hypothetical protein